jgi:hypothetical protein
MLAKILADACGYKIEWGNQGVYKDLVRYIGMHDWAPTLEQYIEHLAALDMFLNKSQSTSSSNTNTNTVTKASASIMDSKKSDITCMAKDIGLTCYNCSQVSHISHNCPNCNWMKKLLKQGLINKDTSKDQSGYLHKDMKKEGVPTGYQESGWIADEYQVKQETDSERESELNNLSDSDSEAEKVKGVQ